MDWGNNSLNDNSLNQICLVVHSHMKDTKLKWMCCLLESSETDDDDDVICLHVKVQTYQYLNTINVSLHVYWIFQDFLTHHIATELFLSLQWFTNKQPLI